MKITFRPELSEEMDKLLVLIECYSLASHPFQGGLDGTSFKNCLIENSIALNDTFLTKAFSTAPPEECGGIIESTDPGQSKIYAIKYQVNNLSYHKL